MRLLAQIIKIVIFSQVIQSSFAQIEFQTRIGFSYNQPFYKSSSNDFYSKYENLKSVGLPGIEIGEQIKLNNHFALKISAVVVGSHVSFDNRAGTDQNIPIQHYDTITYRHTLNNFELQLPIEFTYVIGKFKSIEPYCSIGIGFRKHLISFAKLKTIEDELIFKGNGKIIYSNYPLKRGIYNLTPNVSVGFNLQNRQRSIGYYFQIKYSFLPGLQHYWGSDDWYNDEGLYNNGIIGLSIGSIFYHCTNKKDTKSKI